MGELKRVYWSRQALRLAYSAVIVWLSESLVLALMPDTTAQTSGQKTSVNEIMRGMVDDALAAAALPGLSLVVLVIVAVVIHARDVRRRDPVRRFTRQHRREGMARAGSQRVMEAGLSTPVFQAGRAW